MDSYVSPMRSTAPAGSPTEYTDPKRIDALLKSSDPEAVSASGRGYQKFAAAYEKIAAELLSLRSDLHDAWTGKDAAAAQAQLRQVWSAATTVHQTAMTFGVTIERHGSEHLAWYKYNKPPSRSLPEAQSWMTGANERVAQAWSSLPQDLSTTLPPRQNNLEHGPAGVTPSARTHGPSGRTASAANPGMLELGHRHQGPPAGDSGPSQDEGTGTRLAGSAPPLTVGGGTGLGDRLGPPLGALADVGEWPSTGISGPGLVSQGGVLGARPGMVGVGPEGGVPGLMNEAQAASAAKAQAAAAAAEVRVGAVGPVAGAASEERERYRLTWLAEDEDVWAGGIKAAPHLIQHDPLAADEQAPIQVDASAETDLSADGDVINAILADLNTDVSPDPAEDVSTRINELRAQIARLERQRDAECGLPTIGDDEDSARDWLTGDDA